MTFSKAVLVVVWALVGGTAASQELPPVRTNIVVLVDTSETWLNESFEDLNRDVLRRVGRGMSLAVDRLEGPVRVSYYEIGAASFFRRPRCEAIFQPSLLSGGQAGIISDRHQFLEYFAEECPAVFLHAPPQPLTDITAAIETAVRTQSLYPPEHRIVIVLSDLYEERGTRDFQLSGEHIEGVDFLLLYRSLPTDQEEQRELDERRDEWINRLEELGGDVGHAPDATTSEFEIQQFLLEELR